MTRDEAASALLSIMCAEVDEIFDAPASCLLTVWGASCVLSIETCDRKAFRAGRDVIHQQVARGRWVL